MARGRWRSSIPWVLFIVAMLLGGLFLRDGRASSGRSMISDLNLFNEVLNLVSEFYVEPIASDSLIQGAIEGMLERLDPHSNYIDPERFKQMEERNRGSYQGIGIHFAIRDGDLTVISPIEGGPSDRLGIRAGDVITHINGESARDIKEHEVFERLRGPKATTVEVLIRRRGHAEPLPFRIVRDEIPIESVPYAFMIAPGTGYVRMRNFSARTGEELDQSLDRLEAEGLDRLILDLRGNSGGYLAAAVEVSNMFVDGGKKLVYTLGRIRGSSDEYIATDAATHPTYPLVVLINAGSASASEIVAGAVQDWDRGLVAGQTSFGKGLVQRQYRLDNEGALLLTVARYYTPSGRLIQRPYRADEREEYYQDLIDRDEVPDHTPADTAAAQTFHTLVQQRPVSGGGGITPDVALTDSFQSSALNDGLTFGRKYFDYVNRYLADHSDVVPESFPRFLAEFSVTPQMRTDFRAMLDADAYAYEPESLLVHADEVDRGIRSEIARYLWGENERAQVLVAADPVVGHAIALLPKAEAMLRETQRLEAARAASD